MKLTRAFAVATIAALSLPAHFAWLEAPTELKAGEAVKVKIGFGHEVGKSDSAVNVEGLEVWAISPSGVKTALKPVTADNWVVADFTPRETGVHRFAFAQDRGVISQTTKGYKPGGRDVHPDAKKSMKMWRSGVTETSGKPIGLAFEAVGHRKGDRIEITVFREGKPFSGADVALNVPGQEEAAKIGASDGNGRFTHPLAAGAKGPMLFLVTSVEPAHKGANFDTNNVASVLLVK